MKDVVCVNAVSDQAFWRLPTPLEEAIRARLPRDAELIVARSLAELTRALPRATIALGWPFPAALARGAQELRRVHFFTAGIPESWSAPGMDRVKVTSARGASARSVAQHALFLASAALRGASRVTFRGWEPDAFVAPRAAERLCAAIFGFGAVGTAIAPLVAPLFAAVTPVTRATDWRSVIEETDVVFLALPLSAETRAIVSGDFFRVLRERAIVVNVSAGALVDEADVLAFLARHEANRYATDVVHPEPYPDDGPFLAHSRVLLTPHVAARREDTWSAIGALALAALDESIGSAP
jgi:phosphoglycerate dehydrogenase-like enzyme